MTNEEIKQEIETVKAQLDKLEKKLIDNKKLELTYNRSYFRLKSNGVIVSDNCMESEAKAGATRATRKLAEVASNNMVTRNRLEAWVHERQGNREGDSFLQKDNKGNYVYDNAPYFTIGAVYMLDKTAEWICERLNDGRISLED